MFAVIKTGGKQYKVAENDEIIVEKLDAEAGDQVTFDQVLMLGADGKSTIGAPLVEGASVVAEVSEQTRGPKITIMKKRQRSTYRRKKGHRQDLTAVKIVSILADGKKAPAKKKAAAQKKEVTPKTEAAPAAAPTKSSSDDLTKIRGLGKVFAGKLADEGITSFAQMAALSTDDIAALEEKLGASGKFEKNDWVAQAAEFAKDA